MASVWQAVRWACIPQRAACTRSDTAIELAELLQFIGDWLTSDSENLTESMARFVGNPAYGPGTLRDDLTRFIFLLGGSDGEHFFGPLK